MRDRAVKDRREFNRVRWRSRRGMLELDLVLEPFVVDCYRELSQQDRDRYRALLECDDQNLHAWLLGRQRPPQRELAAIVDAVLGHARRRAGQPRSAAHGGQRRPAAPDGQRR